MATARRRRVRKLRVVRIVEAIVRGPYGKVLLLRRSSNNSNYVGKWQLPGGKAHRSESATAAMRRELFEETGCGCSSLRLVKKIVFSEEFRRRKSTVELSIFSCRLKGSICLSREHSSYKFVKSATLVRKLLAPTSRKALFD